MFSIELNDQFQHMFAILFQPISCLRISVLFGRILFLSIKYLFGWENFCFRPTSFSLCLTCFSFGWTKVSVRLNFPHQATKKGVIERCEYVKSLGSWSFGKYKHSIEVAFYFSLTVHVYFDIWTILLHNMLVFQHFGQQWLRE